MQELAEEHKSLFRSILDHLKEFLSQLKSYFNEMRHNRSREANALKEQVGDTVRYVDSIVNMFDKAAVQAVRNYQATVATDETASSTEITEDEDAALLSYKSGGSYLLNAKFRESTRLSESDQYIVHNLDSALKKLPVFKGTVYRNISFDGMGDKQARDELVSSHVVGGIMKYRAYTSTSFKEDGYPVDGEYTVHFEIESVTGRDMDRHGNNDESEVLFPRGSKFMVTDVAYADDGTPTIHLKEEGNANGRKHQKEN